MWYMGSSSLTRDQPRPPALGTRSLSHWTTKEVPRLAFEMISGAFYSRQGACMYEPSNVEFLI